MILSRDETQSWHYYLDVNARNATSILVDLTVRPYPMCGQDCPDCMYEGLPGKCFLQRGHREGHWCDTCGYSEGNPGERLSQDMNVMEVSADILSTNQESSVAMDVDAESSLRETQITLPMIKCRWCKRERPCEEFEKYPKTSNCFKNRII